MQVTSLKLTNVRVIQSMEFQFQRGFNLVVGVNGVGKTTVLDALAVSLSEIISQSNRLRGWRLVRFADDDIRVGSEVLSVETDFETNEIQGSHSYTIHKLNKNQRGGNGFTRKQLSSLLSNESVSRPLAILFSTNRAVPSNRKPTQGAVAGGIGAACAGALLDRRLNLREFEEWMRTQKKLSVERKDAKHVLAALESAVRYFLPGYGNLRPGDKSEDGGFLLINHGDTTLSVNQLSDGERGVLAMVLDLTRRLAQANPDIENPVTDAGAVVLIDEIDLHLHPQWQRQIVEKLTTTFPRCQFIATTHSPQIIGEVKSERIHVLTEEEVYSPYHSFGVDSSRILQEIMDTEPRTRDIEEKLTKISRQVDDDKFEDARKSLFSIEEILGENDPDVVRLRTLISFLEGD